MIAAIFVVPLVYFINAFLIGRLIKRWKIDVNPFLATIVGFVAFFDVIYIISIWMYAGRAIIWSYFVVIGILQALLIVLYIANWRCLFITWSVNYKKLITFIVVFGLVVLIGWLNFRTYNSDFGKNWIWTIDHSVINIWKPMWFGTTSSDVVSNFSAFNVMNLFWINAFQITIRDNALTFCNWSWTIIAAGFVACLSTWMINKNTQIVRVVFSNFIVLVFIVLILAFIETFTIGDAWVLLLLFAYILMLVKKENTYALKIFVLTALLLGFLAVSCTSFFTVLATWIFTMYFAIRTRQNSLNYALFLSWPLFMTMFSLLSIYTYWLLSLINAIYLAVILITILVIYKLGTPTWDTKIALGVYRHSGKIIYAGLIILIALILVANFFIFQEIYKWKSSNINYKNFLTFTYSYLWTIKLDSATEIALFNAFMYALFVALSITYLVLRNLKKNKLSSVLRQDYAIKFGIISCILFINPLVIHVLKISSSEFPLNTLDMNMLFVVPIFVVALKTNFNLKLLPINNWRYNWY